MFHILRQATFMQDKEDKHACDKFFFIEVNMEDDAINIQVTHLC